jgi:hypothetical protein
MASDKPTKVIPTAATKVQHILTVMLCAFVTPGHAYGQPPQNTPGSIEESIAHVKSGEFGPPGRRDYRPRKRRAGAPSLEGVVVERRIHWIKESLRVL